MSENPKEVENSIEVKCIPREAQIYTSNKLQVIKYGIEQGSQSQLDVDVAYRLRSEFTRKTGKIDLSENETEPLEGVIADMSPPSEPITQDFIVQRCYTLLPQTLMVNLKRAIVGDEGQIIKVNNALEVDKDGSSP